MRSNPSASVLVVDDDPCVANDLSQRLIGAGARDVLRASSVRTGLQSLAIRPHLLITEACLPDGDALGLVRAARGLSSPPIVIVVSSRASRQLVAALMQEGTDAYFDKPVAGEELYRSYEALSDPEDLCRRMARLLVGRMGLKEAQLCLRGSMHAEALARTGGSRRGAANLLQVHRSYVQRMADCQDDDVALESST